MNVQELKDISIDNIFKRGGLYTKYIIDYKEQSDLLKIVHLTEEEIMLDFCCDECNKERLFKSKSINTKTMIGRTYYDSSMKSEILDYLDLIKLETKTSESFEEDAEKNQILEDKYCNILNLIKSKKLFSRYFDCSCERKQIIFIFMIIDNILIKIGQYPSVADLEKNDIGKYRKVLSQEDYKSLNIGVGLYSHGIGIGSFVYLRRVFENLINEAYKQCVSNDEWKVELNYSTMKMKDKINELKHYLPRFVQKNKQLYGVLSSGIHSLSEEECLSCFDILKEGILIILKQKLESIEKEKTEKRISNAINKISSDIINKI